MKFDASVNRFELIGEIERNNKYGNTSSCIDNRHLRKFCYCVDNFETGDSTNLH